MASLIDTMGQFPTVVPMAVLMFCTAWWVVSLVAGAGHQAHPHGHAIGRVGRGGRGRSSGRGRSGGRSGAGQAKGLRKAMRADALPLSLSLTIVSFGAWAVCLLGSLGLDAADLAGAAKVAAGIGVLAAGMFAGLGLLTAAANPLEKVLVTKTAPTRAQAVGSTCRVRTVRDRRGDAKVLTGPTAGAIIPIDLAPGVELSPGDEALVVAYDETDERFIVAELDDVLRSLDNPLA
jgi:hypothetical protein